MASLSDAQIRETLSQPVRLLSPNSPTRRLSQSFRILGRYRTLRHYQFICAGVVTLGTPIELMDPDPLPFILGRLSIAAGFVLGAQGLHRPRSVGMEGLIFGGPMLFMLLLAGVLPLIFAPALFTHEFEAAYLAILVALSLLQLDLLMVFGLAAILALLAGTLVTLAPLSPRVKVDLLLADLTTLAAVCNFRRITMFYRCRNIMVYYKSELQTRALTALTNRLRISAETDQLTGVGNRRHFEDASRALPQDTSIGILMIDIDRFKALNDSLGHAEGDRCLRAVSDAIKSTLREGDIIARYGGEEFIVMIENPGPGTLASLAERIRATVASHVLSPLGPVTVSIGIAMGAAHAVQELVNAADREMYRAKASGRNGVSGDPGPLVTAG